MMQSQMNNDDERQSQLRIEASTRQSSYTHPQLQLHHQPINAKQCQQLHARLKAMIVGKIDEVRKNNDIFEEMEKYEEIYANNFELSIKNDLQDLQAFKDIQQMHNMADILLHPPNFDGDLYLYRKQMPNQYEREQIEKIFKKYEEAYEENQQVDYQVSAEDAIKRAKRFLLQSTQEQTQNEKNSKIYINEPITHRSISEKQKYKYEQNSHYQQDKDSSP